MEEYRADLSKSDCGDNVPLSGHRLQREQPERGKGNSPLIRERKAVSGLRNHREAIAAMDFFTVPTLRFSLLYCSFVISHDRRQILHFNVTNRPTFSSSGKRFTRRRIITELAINFTASRCAKEKSMKRS